MATVAASLRQSSKLEGVLRTAANYDVSFGTWVEIWRHGEADAVYVGVCFDGVGVMRAVYCVQTGMKLHPTRLSKDGGLCALVSTSLKMAACPSANGRLHMA